MKKNLLKIYQLLCALTICLLVAGNPAYSQLPAGFIQKKLTGDVINEATAMVHAPDGRIFIAERSGKVKVLQNGVVSVVHTVSTTTASEQGLLGIALHPQFASNGKCYIFYTNDSMTVHYLDMIVISTNNTVTSSTRIMQFDPIINGFHNGGAILFKDGLLYVAIGESNSSSEAVKLDTYRGKILRLTEDGQPAPGNPYYNVAGATRQRRSIWAIGMRNPWKMSLDPVSQKIFVVNVGGDYEEINDVTAPDASKNYNYGWDQNGKSGPDQAAGTIQPVFAYPHTDWGCAITSGVFFNPPATNYPPQYLNRFYFSDWCNDWYRSVDATNPGAGYQELSHTGFGSILGTSVGIDGNIYYIKYNTTGSVWRIEFDNNQAPAIVNQPVSQTVVAQDPVTFTVTASGATPFTYQWQKNTVDIAGATTNTYTIASASATDSGSYRVIVRNAIGNITSNPAILKVTPFNARPVPHILTPVGTLTWNVLDTVRFSGNATDLEDGTLPASAYHWEVRFFHKDNPTSEHWHPGPVIPGGIKSGTFIADNGGESSPNIWFRILLTATDSQGRTGTDSVDIQPNKVVLTADATPQGLKLILGTQETTPFSKTFVVNSAFVLQAVSPQVLGDSSYAFASWAHGGDALQSLRVPKVNTTYKAKYNVSAALQNPYLGVPATIPGKIEIENFDTGGEGFAYHDASTGNAGNQYRTTEDVDLENCSEGGYNIGYVAAGEWLEYTVNVTTPGVYTLSARVANPGAAKTFHAELDGVNISGGNVAVPTTGGFQAWQTVSVTTPALTAGVKVLRITLDANDFNVNYVTFTNGGSNGGGGDTTVTGGTNLALNKPTRVSSVENAGLGGSSAVDGSQTSRWSSAFEDPQYIFVDLGAIYNINEVKIYWENALGKDYEVQVSNDSITWSRVKAITGNTTTLNDHTGLTATGRYVRIYGTIRNTPYGYSINELEVYGTLSSSSIAYVPETKTDAFKVYPNPVYSVLTIGGVKTAHLFNIINISTSQVTKMESANGTLNVGRLPAGTYIVEFKEGNKVVRKKFVKL
jgi:glucose/arabinose dehydrogenase